MYLKEALRVFGTRAKIFKALGGTRHRSAVYQWSEEGLIPMVPALMLARKAKEKGHALKVNLDLYDRQSSQKVRQLAGARAARKK